MIVSDDLARKLFPSGNALGQVVYWNPAASSRIVGIVERAQTPWAAWTGIPRTNNPHFCLITS